MTTDAEQVLKNWEFYFGKVTSINLNSSHMKTLKEKAENWDDAVKFANQSLDSEGGDEPPCVDIRDWVNGLRRNLTICAEKIASVQEWAFNMGCMLEDCTYLSMEQFDKDAKLHLESLVALVGKWVPPELRDSGAKSP